ncbi:MAG: nucleotidyltransferase family protein [Clostridia bacterium]|nr:nucleotidyltransferase family protein [Clostridia bacterium]
MKRETEKRSGSNEQIKRLFFASLLAALEKRAFSDKERADFDPALLPSLYALADSQDLAQMVGFPLKQSDLLPKNSPACKAFQKKEMLALFTTERMEYETRRCSGALEEAGISFLPLKGAKLRRYYPEGYFRTSSDVDVLVRPEDCDRAVEVLCGLGYEKKADTGHYDHKLVSRSGICLELHYALMDGESLPSAAPFLKRVWEESLPAGESGLEREMPPEHFLTFHLIHMAKHFVLGGCGVRPFLDLYLLEQKMPYDKDAFSALLEETGLSAFYRACTVLCAVWLGGRPHDEWTCEMEDFLLAGGLFGSYENEAAVEAGAEGKGKRRFRRVFFLPRKNLELIYPNLKKRPLLYPLYQVRRWFGVFDPKRRARLRAILRAGEGVTSEKASHTAALLAHLEIKK